MANYDAWISCSLTIYRKSTLPPKKDPYHGLTRVGYNIGKNVRLDVSGVAFEAAVTVLENATQMVELTIPEQYQELVSLIAKLKQLEDIFLREYPDAKKE